MKKKILIPLTVKDIYDKNDYQNIMNGLYFETKDKEKKDLFSKLSKDAQHQFSQLNSLINNHFKIKPEK